MPGFLILTLAVVVASFVYLYRGYRSQLEAELGRRLVAVATASAAAVNGETWTALARGDSAAAAAVRFELEEVRRVNGVSDIFLFTREETTVLDLGDQYPAGARNPALIADVEPATTALAGLATTTRLFSREGSYLKSAYAPVWSGDGDVLGGVGVEASATFFEVLGRVRRTLVAAAALVVAGVIVLGLVFSRLLAAQEGLESRLRRTETLATMGQMASMLAHEIRNPLGIIRGAAERLGTRYDLAGDELYRFIPEEVDRLERTLGSYLDFARPHGTPGIDDARRALDRTLELMAPELERKGIRLEAELEAGPCPVRGDAHLLQQAFLNVILNARDAMESGGSLAVTLRRRGRRAEITVADSGAGMSPEVLARATEPFFTSKERGSGLGLAAVARLMDDLGGRLDIRSRPGHGTRVELVVPLARGTGSGEAS